MLKNRKLLGILLSIVMVFAFGMSGLATDYKYTQESGTGFFVSASDKSDALEDTNEIRQIEEDIGTLLGNTKIDGTYPKDGKTGGTLQIPEAGLKYSNAPANNDIAAYIAGEMKWQTLAELSIQPLDTALTNISALAYVSPSFIKLTANDTYAVRTLAEVKTDLSLNLVTNTSDADKPVSTAQQTALDLKANLISPSFTNPVLGTPASGTLTNCTFPTLNQNTTGTAANVSGTPALPNGTTATTQAGSDNSTKLATTAYADALAKGDVGLGNVENLKVKLDGTQAPAAATDDVTLGYAVGSRWFDITNDKEYVCLDNTDTAAVWTETTGAAGGYTNLTSFVAQTAWRVFYSNADGDVTELALGADGTYLKSNGAAVAPTFAAPAGGGDALTTNPLSQFAATTSAELAGVISDETGSGLLVYGTSPNITTPTGIVKGDVGLGNVDNTADTAKPVSTAQQTALDLKANIASPTFTGTVTIPTPFTLGAVSVLPTGTELNFVDGVTSAIQTQLNTKLANVVEDTTPDLGGEMDAGAHSIGFTLQTVAEADGTTTIDWKLGNHCKVTLGAQAETFTFTAPTNPQTVTLIIVQDGTGGRDITWPGTVHWLGTEPTWSDGGAGKGIVVGFIWDGAIYWGQGTPWEL